MQSTYTFIKFFEIENGNITDNVLIEIIWTLTKNMFVVQRDENNIVIKTGIPIREYNVPSSQPVPPGRALHGLFEVFDASFIQVQKLYEIQFDTGSRYFGLARLPDWLAPIIFGNRHRNNSNSNMESGQSILLALTPPTAPNLATNSAIPTTNAALTGARNVSNKRRREDSNLATSFCCSCKKRFKPNSVAVTEAKDTPKLRCIICLEFYIERNVTSTKCGHVFCGECIIHAVTISGRCPLCNMELTLSDLTRLFLT